MIIPDTCSNFIIVIKQKIVIWPLHLPLTVENLNFIMKKLMLLSVLCLMSMATFAQKNAVADAAVAALSSKVELTDAQKSKLMSIESQLASDLAVIADLKTEDPAMYYQKLSYLKEVKLGQVKKLISEDQLESYITYRKAESKKRTDAYKKMEAEGLSELEIRIKLMESM